MNAKQQISEASVDLIEVALNQLEMLWCQLLNKGNKENFYLYSMYAKFNGKKGLQNNAILANIQSIQTFLLLKSIQCYYHYYWQKLFES